MIHTYIHCAYASMHLFLLTEQNVNTYFNTSSNPKSSETSVGNRAVNSSLFDLTLYLSSIRGNTSRKITGQTWCSSRNDGNENDGIEGDNLTIGLNWLYALGNMVVTMLSPNWGGQQYSIQYLPAFSCSSMSHTLTRPRCNLALHSETCGTPGWQSQFEHLSFL